MCPIFNNFLNRIIKQLKIPIDPSLLEDVSISEDLILVPVLKHQRHSSIHKIKETIQKNDIFYFHHKDCNKMLTILQNLDCKRTTE